MNVIAVVLIFRVLGVEGDGIAISNCYTVCLYNIMILSVHLLTFGRLVHIYV
jgi:hypothetical protein